MILFEVSKNLSMSTKYFALHNLGNTKFIIISQKKRKRTIKENSSLLLTLHCWELQRIESLRDMVHKRKLLTFDKETLKFMDSWLSSQHGKQIICYQLQIIYISIGINTDYIQTHTRIVTHKLIHTCEYSKIYMYLYICISVCVFAVEW